VSGLSIKDLLLVGAEKYKFFKGVRTFLRSGRVQIRTWAATFAWRERAPAVEGLWRRPGAVCGRLMTSPLLSIKRKCVW